MSEPIWNKFLTERDKAVFKTSGYGARGGFGKRPALLIIDVNYAFCDERPMPILESIKRWRNSCGEDAWVAMPYLKALIDKAHAKGIPVIYTTGVRREDNWDSGSWTWKNGRSDEDMTSKPATNVDGNDIVAEIARARDRARRLQPQLPHRAGRGGLLRPLAGEPRHQPLRHERQIRRRGEDVGGARLFRQPPQRHVRPAEGVAGTGTEAAPRREHVNARRERASRASP